MSKTSFPDIVDSTDSLDIKKMKHFLIPVFNPCYSFPNFDSVFPTSIPKNSDLPCIF